jgi:hypothetical protein
MLLNKMIKFFKSHQNITQTRKGDIITIVFKLGKTEVYTLILDVGCVGCKSKS